MKVLNSKLFDFINNILFYIQSKLCFLKEKSFLLSNIDFLIYLSIVLVYVVSIISSNNLTAIFALGPVILILVKLLTVQGEKIELKKSNFYLLIYFLICFISNITSSLMYQSFYGFSKTILYFAFYFAVYQFLKSNKRYIIPILAVIALLVSAESIIGLLQNSKGVANIATWQDTSYLNPEDILTRVYGTLKPYNPNLFGGWLIAGISSLMGMSAIFIFKKRIILAILSIISVLLSSLCIFFTGCRGAYIALFFIFVCLFFVLIRINKYCKTGAILMAVSGIVFVLFHNGILRRLMSIFLMRGDSSASFRINVYNSALNMFKDNPIFGIGSGNKVFREIYGLYMLSGFDALSCYSVFLEMAVESGIFSLMAFLLFLCSLLKYGITEFILRKDVIEKIILFTAVTAIMAIIVHGFVDTIYFRPQIQFIFWTMVAIIMA